MKARCRCDVQSLVVRTSEERLDYTFRATDEDVCCGCTRSNGHVKRQARTITGTRDAVGGRRGKLKHRKYADINAAACNETGAVCPLRKRIRLVIVVRPDSSEA